jgi:Spy/CpxP family protein refolding chaperone
MDGGEPMRKKFLLIILIISLVFNIAFIGALGYRLWNRKHHGPPRPRVQKERMHDRERFAPPPELKLRIDELREDFMPRIQSHRKRMKEAREDLIRLIEQEDPDSLELESVLNHLSVLQLHMDRDVIFYLLRRKAILPPEHQGRFLEGMKRRLRLDRHSGQDRRQTGRRREDPEPKPNQKKEE